MVCPKVRQQTHQIPAGPPDAAVDVPAIWKADLALRPLCQLLHPSAKGACEPKRRLSQAPASTERTSRLIVQLIAPSDKVTQPSFAVERLALRPQTRSSPRIGLRVLSLQVGRILGSAPDEPLGYGEAPPVLALSSVIWPARGVLGLLARLEVLPMALPFEVLWRGPSKEVLHCFQDASERASHVWSPFPGNDTLQLGTWQVALYLGRQAPGVRQLLGWRRFLIIPDDARVPEKDRIKDASGPRFMAAIGNEFEGFGMHDFFDLVTEPPTA